MTGGSRRASLTNCSLSGIASLPTEYHRGRLYHVPGLFTRGLISWKRGVCTSTLTCRGRNDSELCVTDSVPGKALKRSVISRSRLRTSVQVERSALIRKLAGMDSSCTSAPVFDVVLIYLT